MQQVGFLRHAPHHIFCQIKGSYCIFVDILALFYHIFWLIKTQLSCYTFSERLRFLVFKFYKIISKYLNEGEYGLSVYEESMGSYI